MGVLNLTQHPATAEQKKAGVFEPAPEVKAEIRSLLTFDAPPSTREMAERAEKLAAIACEEQADAVMIGGAPFFMSTLEAALLKAGCRPVYAFSIRKTVERVNEDGEVVKTSVFVHSGFVEGGAGIK